MELTDEHKVLIGSYVSQFEEFQETERGKEWQKERSERLQLYGDKLRKEQLGAMTELDFGEIIKPLWALGVWTNKDYVINKIITDNGGIEKIYSELIEILYGLDSPKDRYDRFLRLKGMGTSLVSEFLTFVFPKEFCIWNDRSRKSLSKLQMDKLLPSNIISKTQISGDEYVECIKVLELIRKELSSYLKDSIDFIDVDFFLAFIFYFAEEPTAVIPPKVKDYDFDHDDIITKLEAIGVGLGFEVEREKAISKGSRVDLIWKAKIGNLGSVSYVFEVHREGSIKSLIVNLLKALNNPTVQKLVAVSNAAKIDKIKDEVEDLSEDFRKALTFFEVNDVEKATEHLTELSNLLNRVGLLPKEY